MERFLTDSARRTESRSAAAINQRVRQIRRGSEGHSLFIGDGLTGYRDGVGGDGAMTVHIIIGGVLGGIKGGIIGGVGGAIVGTIVGAILGALIGGLDGGIIGGEMGGDMGGDGGGGGE